MRLLRWSMAVLAMASFALDDVAPLGNPAPASAPVSRGDPGAATFAHLDTLLSANQLDSVHSFVSLRMPRAVAAGDSVAMRALILARGRAEQAGGSMREARESYRLVREWSESARDTVRWMDALRGGAYTAGGLGIRDEAVALNTRLLELARASGDLAQEAWARTGFAYMAMVAGNLTAARAEYLNAVRLFRRAGDRRAELTPLVGLGRVYTNSGLVDSARACFQRVWLSAGEMGWHVDAAHALNNLGTLEHRYGDLTLAMDYYQRAFETHRSQGEVAGAITAASNLALARQGCGRYDEAIDGLRQQLSFCEAAGLRAQAGLVTKNLGYAYIGSQRYHTAKASFRRVLAMGDTVETSVWLDAAHGLADGLAIDSLDAGIAVLQHALSRDVASSTASDVVLRLALARLLAAADANEEALLEARRIVAGTAANPGTRLHVSALLVASRCYRSAGKADSAMAMLDAGVVSLREMIATTPQPAGRYYLSDLTRAAEVLLEYPPLRPASERYAAFFDLLEEFRTTTGRESFSDPRRKRAEPVSPITLHELQQEILAPGDLLLEFFVSSNRTHLLAVSRDTVTCVAALGPFTPLHRQIEDYCDTASEPPGADALVAGDLARFQMTLGEELLGPVAGLVTHANRLMIVPDRYLHAVPFASLALPDANGTPVTLLERAPLFVLPSASVLKARATPNEITTKGTFLVVTGDDTEGEPLPGARTEARAIEKRFAGVVQRRAPLTTQELGELMEASRIIHVAAHIDVNAQEPWYSGIQVGVAPASAEVPSPVRSASLESMVILSTADSLRVAREFAPDPFLRAHRVADLTLSARLAVLSGCESAMGRLTIGEGVTGLASAFMHAGVPTVIGSLWQIDDRTTVELMRAFYHGLSDGQSIADALRHAQLKLRAQPHTAHPYYWAGFVVVGDGRETVSLVERSLVSPAAKAVVSLLLLTVAGWFLVRPSRRKKSHRPV